MISRLIDEALKAIERAFFIQQSSYVADEKKKQ